MRFRIVTGLLVVAWSAGAQTFGVDFETANDALTKTVRPPLVLQGCESRVCTYRAQGHDIEAHIGLGEANAVERFSVLFRPNNWAVAAAYARSIQRSLFVPERDIAGADRLAENAAQGVVNDERTNAVICESQTIAEQPVIFCRRK